MLPSAGCDSLLLAGVVMEFLMPTRTDSIVQLRFHCARAGREDSTTPLVWFTEARLIRDTKRTFGGATG